jgi:tetratricopeptide (TPR) repeat protein
MPTAKIQTSIFHKIGLIVFGLFLSALVTEITLWTAAAAYKTIQTINNKRVCWPRSDVRILCLGESTTSGAYPRLLEQYLKRKRPDLNFCVIDEGHPAVTTEAILEKLKDNLARYRPDIVVTMMGINEGSLVSAQFQGMITKKKNHALSLKVFKLARWLYWNLVSRIGQFVPANNLRNKSVNGDRAMRWTPNPSEADKILYRRWLNLHAQGKNAEAETLLRKTIADNMSAGFAYGLLLWTLDDMGKHSEAKQVFETAEKRHPDCYLIYYRWGLLCRKTARPEESERAFRQAISLWPQNDSPYIELFMDSYFSKKKEAAEDILAEALALKIETARVLGALSLVQTAAGKPYSANRPHWVLSPQTEKNYRDLWQTLRIRGIRYVCVQYPMREIATLKNIFPADADIVYVDNERLFREAVIRDGPAAYFKDLFGGDFGHCTAEGNELLAENIAEVIARDILK